MTLNDQQKAIIVDALLTKAEGIRRETTASARAMGKWDTTALKPMLDEVAAVENLAELFGWSRKARTR